MTAQVGGAALSFLTHRPSGNGGIGMAVTVERDQLRREMRARRRGLSRQTRRAAAASFASIIARAHLLRPGLKVALYVCHGSEADPSKVIALAHRRGCKVYLPVIGSYRRNHMDFVRCERGQPLRANRFGILEPERHAMGVKVSQLDIVFVPLLAVDAAGTRLGSGQGFYDRRLRRLRLRHHWRRPYLIGLAYEFQRIAHLSPETWDVPLDAVVTERSFYPIALQVRGPA